MSTQRIRCGVLLCMLLCWSSPALALEDDACRTDDRWGWAVPDHAKLQTGGYLGLITLGVGYSAWQMLDVDVYYGWVPEGVGGTDIHALAARISMHPPGLCIARDLRWTMISAGLGGLMTFGRGFFLLSPDPHPANYYPMTGLRVLFSLATELHFVPPCEPSSVFSSHGLVVELTALDQYLFTWLGNSSVIDPWDVWSMTLGYKASF
jgi:hypothetical protein